MDPLASWTGNALRVTGDGPFACWSQHRGHGYGKGAGNSKAYMLLMCLFSMFHSQQCMVSHSYKPEIKGFFGTHCVIQAGLELVILLF